MKPRANSTIVLTGLTALLASALSSAGAQPASGPIVPELAPVEQAVTNFMATHSFEAGTIALMKDSKLVLRQGYGWRDKNKTVVIHPDNLFRLASVSKPITGSAIRKLVNAGQLSTSTKVYSYLGIPPWGGTLGDNRITNITVQHLLDHAGGWDRNISPVGDAVFSTIQISTEMGLSFPADPTNVISWMFSKPLDFTPGTAYIYSNFGYDVLGRVIEKVSGKSYVNYLQQDLLGPFGITNIVLSRSRPRDLDPWEIWYADSATVYRSAVDYPTNIYVRWVDGGGYYESFDSFGGLSASAPALCRYMLNYWVGGERRVPGSSYGWTYIFYGSLPGATSVIHQGITQNSTSTNGLEFAALFNIRTGSNDNDEAHTAIANAAANVTSWPANGGGMIQWSVSATNVNENAGSVTVQLVRSAPATLPVKVSYTTYGKTAGVTNYTPGSGIVAFAAGETNKSVTVTILDDGIVALPKDFLLELISASGGAWLGDRVTATVRILDTDLAFVGASSILGDGSFRTQVRGATGMPVRVEFSTNLLNWQLLQTFTNIAGQTTVTDTNAPNRPRSFYRAVTP
jgi:CubicO group peptidase (beta-lactamase class C family)